MNVIRIRRIALWLLTVLWLPATVSASSQVNYEVLEYVLSFVD